MENTPQSHTHACTREALGRMLDAGPLSFVLGADGYIICLLEADMEHVFVRLRLDGISSFIVYPSTSSVFTVLSARFAISLRLAEFFSPPSSFSFLFGLRVKIIFIIELSVRNVLNESIHLSIYKTAEANHKFQSPSTTSSNFCEIFTFHVSGWNQPVFSIFLWQTTSELIKIVFN